MSNHIITDVSESLHHFLHQVDLEYQQSLASIPLFKPQNTGAWNKEQKKTFASVFYHLRGHFINFIWYIANFSKSEQIKKIILDNIHEELGVGACFSHEMLYERFAKECDVNIHDEIINETNYVPFARNFNKSHMQWLSIHDEDERISAFAAYERLDNLDYPHLEKLADSIHLTPHAKTFFRVHTHVTHFDSTLDLILPLWEKNPDKVVKSFDYIYTHQQQMWNNLSHYMCAQ